MPKILSSAFVDVNRNRHRPTAGSQNDFNVNG